MNAVELSAYVDALPNICGSEPVIEEATRQGRARPASGEGSALSFDDIDAAFAIALHMHQPLIPAGGPDLRTAPSSAT